MSVLKTVRGLPVPDLAVFSEIDKGNPRIDDLVRRYLSYEHRDVSFILDLIDTAKDYFVGERGEFGFGHWLSFQLNNPSSTVGFLHYSFIMDTIKFISSGYRRVRPNVMISMIGNGTSSDRLLDAQKQEAAIQRLKIETFIKDESKITPYMNLYFLYEWVNQEGGVEDLLYTLAYLFGGTIENLENEIFL